MRLCLDACVLYPTVLRELLMGLARVGRLEPVWSARILEEWARAAARIDPSAETVARGEIALMRATWPGAEVPAAPDLEAQLWLPDPNDIHVLASAITGQAAAILTFNLKDFPRRALVAQDLTALHPDAFLRAEWGRAPDQVTAVATEVHARAEHLSGDRLDRRRFFKRARLPRLAKVLD